MTKKEKALREQYWRAVERVQCAGWDVVCPPLSKSITGRPAEYATLLARLKRELRVAESIQNALERL